MQTTTGSTAAALARLNLGYTQVAAYVAGRTSTSLVTQSSMATPVLPG